MRTRLLERMKNRECHISVIGLGHVGFPLIKLAGEQGFTVVGLDTDEEQVSRAVGSGIDATTDPRAALSHADCTIICVPTPIDDDHRPNLRIVKTVSETIAKHLKRDALVVLESTVAPGTTEEVLVPILEKSGLTAGSDFFVAHCPERVDPGNTRWTVRNIPRVVGGISDESTAIARSFYEELLDAEVVRVSDVKTAEAVKVVENTFRDVNIAFVNELAKSFDRIGIDISEVIAAASTKPFGFMPHYPGCGVGGHCIAVDPYYLIDKAGKTGFNHRFLKLAREINDSMPEYTVQKVIMGLNERGLCVKDADIAVLGLAYKGGTDDTRESPAFQIIDRLEYLGANLTLFDPHVPQESTAEELDVALEGKDCIVVVTDHSEFKDISGGILKEKNVKVVVDGRNILDKKSIETAGMIYKGIGR